MWTFGPKVKKESCRSQTMSVEAVIHPSAIQTSKRDRKAENPNYGLENKLSNCASLQKESWIKNTLWTFLHLWFGLN